MTFVFRRWPAATNLCTNGGFETNTTGWSHGVNTTITQSDAQSKFGEHSGLVTFTEAFAGQRTAYIGVTAPGAGLLTASVWVYVPSGQDYTQITINLENFTGSSTVSSTTWSGQGSLVGQWVRIHVTQDIVAGDLNGLIVLRFTNPGTANIIYIDGVQIEAGSVATPYIETDGGTASRSAGPVIGNPSSTFKIPVGQVS